MYVLSMNNHDLNHELETIIIVIKDMDFNSNSEKFFDIRKIFLATTNVHLISGKHFFFYY